LDADGTGKLPAFDYFYIHGIVLTGVMALHHLMEFEKMLKYETAELLDDQLLDDQLLEIIAKRMSAMGDVTRLKILQWLIQREEMSVTQLCEAVGARPSNISQHLSVLFNAELVGKRKEGNNVFYYIHSEMVKTVCSAVCESLRTDLMGKGELLEKIPVH
jgi:DNA-binding transcriptional ArsR family regulator